MRAFTVPLLVVVGISAIGFATAPSAGTPPASTAIADISKTARSPMDELTVHDRTVAAHLTLSVLEDAARQGIVLDAAVPMASAARDYSGL